MGLKLSLGRRSKPEYKAVKQGHPATNQGTEHQEQEIFIDDVILSLSHLRLVLSDFEAGYGSSVILSPPSFKINPVCNDRGRPTAFLLIGQLVCTYIRSRSLGADAILRCTIQASTGRFKLRFSTTHLPAVKDRAQKPRRLSPGLAAAR